MSEPIPTRPIIEHLVVLDITGTAGTVPSRDRWTTYGSIPLGGDVAQDVLRLFVYGRPHAGEEVPEVVSALTDEEADAIYDRTWTYPDRAALLDRIYEVFQPCRVAYPGPSGAMVYETRGRDA